MCHRQLFCSGLGPDVEDDEDDDDDLAAAPGELVDFEYTFTDLGESLLLTYDLECKL